MWPPGCSEAKAWEEGERRRNPRRWLRSFACQVREMACHGVHKTRRRAGIAIRMRHCGRSAVMRRIFHGVDLTRQHFP